MKYSQVFLESLGYELPPIVVSSAVFKACLEPLYTKLSFPERPLLALTSISERRWWEPNYPLSEVAILRAEPLPGINSFHRGRYETPEKLAGSKQVIRAEHLH